MVLYLTGIASMGPGATRPTMASMRPPAGGTTGGPRASAATLTPMHGPIDCEGEIRILAYGLKHLRAKPGMPPLR